MKNKRALGLGMALVVTAATLLGHGGVASAQQVVTKTTTLSYRCANPTTAGVTLDFGVAGSFSVQAPATVRAGETFDFVVTPNALNANGRNLGRLAYEVNVPTGAELLSATALQDGVGITGATPKVDRMGLDRQLSATGPLLRLWGGQATSGGLNGMTTNSSAAWNAGIYGSSTTSVRLPSMKLTMKAPASPTGPATLSLPGVSGVDPKVSDVSASNFLYVAQKSTSSSSVFAYACSSGINATPLASVGLKATPSSSSVALTSVPEAVRIGAPVPLSATVSSAEGTPAELSAGTVEFRLADGTLLGSASPDASGVASISASLPALPTGVDARTDTITATFTGTAVISPSTSPAKSIEVLRFYPDRRDVSLEVSQAPVSGGSATVTATAKVSGGSIPAGLRAQLYRDGSAVGPPVAVGANGAATFTDRAPQLEKDTTYAYDVRLVPLSLPDSVVTGSSSSASVIVPGSKYSNVLTPGYTSGSADIGAIFSDPAQFLERTGGSINNLGVLSIQLTARP